MKKTIISSAAVLAITVSLTVTSANAAEKMIDLEGGDAIMVRSELGVGWYFGNLDDENSSDGWDISFAHTDLTLGTTFLHDRFSLDAYVRTNLGTIGSDWTANTGATIESDEDISRWEVNLTSGYLLTEKVSGFVGVRYASTDADQNTNPFGGKNTNHFEFKTTGVTAGLKGGWVTGKHMYSILGGLTYAKSDLERTSPFFPDLSAKPDSFGGVLGAQYRYLYSDNVDFSLSVDAYHLDFGTVDDAAGTSWELSEQTASARLGINYTF